MCNIITPNSNHEQAYLHSSTRFWLKKRALVAKRLSPPFAFHDRGLGTDFLARLTRPDTADVGVTAVANITAVNLANFIVVISLTRVYLESPLCPTITHSRTV